MIALIEYKILIARYPVQVPSFVYRQDGHELSDVSVGATDIDTYLSKEHGRMQEVFCISVKAVVRTVDRRQKQMVRTDLSK